MSKKRRTYKCGKCGNNGHNARTCPTKADVSKAVTTTKPTPAPTPVVAEATTPAEAPVEDDPAPTGQFPLDGSSDLTIARRTSTETPKVPAAPYNCPSCHQVAVLVLVELLDGKQALRCEKCRNSTPISKIVKWGAFPKDKPAEAWHRKSSLI
jgi:DNA-directed RNA polymerase subunit RPC12/RpoP